MSENLLARYNFVTGQYDYVGEIISDEQAKQYISQDPSVQDLYEIRRLQGDSIVEAMIVVLKATIGERA